ncbi:MAG: hypothetical protein H6719_25160 [Sandaracinaceae bacterium]|nr:hypothetical protein [Sandaracinaceae bacterium]
MSRRARVWMLCWALVGCDGDPVGNDAGERVDASESLDAGARDGAVLDAAMIDGAAPDGGTPPVGHCFDGPVDVSSAGGLTTARTARYEVEAQVDAAQAELFARMLEAAWTAQVDFFGGEPTPALPLRVRVFRDQAAFEAGLAEDGLGPVGDAGGYYEPSNATAYLFDQPTRYFTRMLVLHEATHQFHDAVRAAGTLPFWYVEGVAEAQSRHDWDGRCIRLGVVPLLTFEDAPAGALRTLEAGATLADVVDEALTPSRAIAWSIFRYLEDGPNRAAFRRFRARVDDGAAIPDAFRDELGDPAALDAGWIPAVRAAQEPMTPVFLEWIHVDPSTLDGFADVFTVAVVKAPVTRFETSFAAPSTPGWSGGVVLGYESPTRFVALVVRDSGRLQRFDVDGGAVWNDVGAAPAAVGGRYAFTVEHGASGAVVTVNGTELTVDTGLPARSGPALDAASVRFEDLRWE